MALSFQEARGCNYIWCAGLSCPDWLAGWVLCHLLSPLLKALAAPLFLTHVLLRAAAASLCSSGRKLGCSVQLATGLLRNADSKLVLSQPYLLSNPQQLSRRLSVRSMGTEHSSCKVHTQLPAWRPCVVSLQGADTAHTERRGARCLPCCGWAAAWLSAGP